MKVSGTPDPQLIWYHESTCLDNDYAHEISTDGSLTIVTTEMKHSGTYKLVAISSVGRAERKFTLKLVSDTTEQQTTVGSNAVSHPISMTELGRYVARNHADTNKGFTTLYRVSYSSTSCGYIINWLTFFQSLDSCEREHTVTVAVTATNNPLNRFKNITVCEYYTFHASIPSFVSLSKLCILLVMCCLH